MECLTSEQVSEWEAYDKIDPIGAWRADYRMAYTACTMTNLIISVHGKKGTPMTVPKDFMPEWDDDGQPKKQTMEEMKAWMLNFAKAHNASLQIQNKIGVPNNPPKRVVQPYKNRGL